MSAISPAAPPTPRLRNPRPGLISDPFRVELDPGLGRGVDAWLPGSWPPALCKADPDVPEKTTTKAPGKTPKSTKKWVTKSAETDNSAPRRCQPLSTPGSQAPRGAPN